jgi:hypothetical protein
VKYTPDISAVCMPLVMGRYSQPATAAEIPHLPRKCQFLRNGNWLSHQAKVLIHVAKVTRQYANKVAENFVVRNHGRNVE